MRRKRSQRWIAMLLAAAMLAGTIESTGIAQTLHSSTEVSDVQQSDAEAQQETEESQEIELPQRVQGWGDTYQTVSNEEEAEAFRTETDTEKILVTAAVSELSGLTFDEMAAVDTDCLSLSDIEGELLYVEGSTEIRLYGAKLDQLYIRTEENVSLQMDSDTAIPEIFLEGSGSVCVEGNSTLGMVRVTEPLEQLTVRATCSILNESEEAVSLETPEGDADLLQSGQQKEVVLSAYPVIFMTEGEIYQSIYVKPGETIPFPEETPEKEGCIFTTWYTDEAYTEPCSQFAVAEGATTLYARFVEESEMIQVTFDSMGGKELEPLNFAKGETLLNRAVNEIYTEKEGYAFGGWCTDEACTTAFSYTEPLEESITLYAFFVSEEAQETTKDSNIASFTEFDWQDTIALRTDQEMTVKEAESKIQLEAGTGELEPEIMLEEIEQGFLIRGAYYENDGVLGFEPGATFTIHLSDGLYFADYPDETDTAVISVYKEQVEVVGFSEEMTYVLWDEVLEYTPVTAIEEETETEIETEAETGLEKETETDEAAETLSDPYGEDAEELEEAAYTPGTILVKKDGTYQKGDLVAFYDGEIGRDEKSMEAYSEGSFDGYVLFAQILDVEKENDGILLTYGYASPEDYLADFDVHITEDADLEGELSGEDLEVLTSRLSRQVEQSEELKAQMLVSVMSASETQDMLNERYGAGVYTLAKMKATLKTNKPTVKLTVSGSDVTAKISVTATATIKDGKEVLLTVKPTLSFTQSVSVKLNVNGGKVWIDMSVTIRTTSKIELTVTATSGGSTSVFSKAKDTLAEIAKPEGISDEDYDSYDEAVGDLMDTMSSIVSTSLEYNDIFDVLLLKLTYSFYGIITIKFEVHLVGQIGVLATFGIEIIATSGEKVGFKYNFLKFKGSSYTEKLNSGVTSNIYLIGKVGARVGIRLILSVTMCGIATASITGDLLAYAELTGIFFNTTNLRSGANTNLGALRFEVGIDVEVSLGLKVKLIFKTIKKSWTVYEGRWPIWSKSVSSKMTYMDGEKLEKQWKKVSANTDNKTVFGFEKIPMKTWDLMSGKCQENEQLFAKSGKFRLEIENLIVNGEEIAADDPRNALFKVGEASKKQNPGSIYMDVTVAGKYACETVELDLVLIYEDKASSACVKKQTQRFHLKKQYPISTTTHEVKVVLQDWCAKKWGLEAAQWDNAVIYETAFTSSYIQGMPYEPTATGTLNLDEIAAAARSTYPELSQYTCEWIEPFSAGALIQYKTPWFSNFCYMTPENGSVRYEVLPYTDSYNGIYYLYVRRFEGETDTIRYHITLHEAKEDFSYEFRVKPTGSDKVLSFTKTAENTYLLETSRGRFNGSDQPLMVSIDDAAAVRTGFALNGREYQQDVYFDLTLGRAALGIQLGKGIKGYEFADPSIVTEEGIRPGTKVELKVELEEGYGALEAICKSGDADLTINDDRISFSMPVQNLSVQLQAYKMYYITYEYQYGGYGTYETVCYAENVPTQEIKAPKIEDMTFRGWYTTPDCTGEAYQFGNTLGHDVTLYADWTCDVTVHFSQVKGKPAYLTGEEDQLQEHLIFEKDSGTYYQFTYSELRVGEKLPNFVIPEYAEYQFMGWYTNPKYEGEPIDLSVYTLTGGVHLYAKWAKLLTVVFDFNDGGGNENSQEMAACQNYPLLSLPEIPQRLHYEFTGWYRNRAATDPFDTENETVLQDMTLYAGWKAADYTITYELDSGVNAAENPLSYTTEDTFTLRAPQRTGYCFDGWIVTGSDIPVKDVTVNAGGGGDLCYRAVWTPEEYQITYEKTYDLALDNPTIYTVESGEIILKNPVREKYEFKGWIGTELETPTMEVHIPAGSVGDRIYTATWETSVTGLKILDRIEKLAESSYEGNLIDALAQIGVTINENTQEISAEEYKMLDDAIRNAVSDHLLALIQNDGEEGSYKAEEIGSYADQIQLVFLSAEADRMENQTQQIYTCQFKAVYNDESGEVYERNVTIKAYLSKAGLALTAPTASNLKLREAVKQSTLSGGTAAAPALSNMTVLGTFAWSSEVEELVPFGYNNAENAYTVVFTPEQRDLYAVTEITVPLLTQVELMVVGEAEDRQYRYDTAKTKSDLSATGTAWLVYVNETGTGPLMETDSEGEQSAVKFTAVEGLLKEGTWSFADGKPEKDKTAKYTGYSLDPSKEKVSSYDNEEAYYVLKTGAVTATASITAIPLSSKHVSTTEFDKTYYDAGTEVKNIDLSTLQVTYSEENVDGTWSWKCSADTKPKAGDSQSVIFTSDPKYEGGFGTGFEYQLSLKVKVPTSLKQTGSVTPIYYGQKLTSAADNRTETVNGENGIVTRCAANKLLSGFEITSTISGNDNVQGSWYWVTETDNSGNETLIKKKDDKETEQVTQPLSVGTYQIKVIFQPDSPSFAAYATFVEIEVKASEPYVGACSLSASMYQNNSHTNQLVNAVIMATGTAKNKYTGAEVAGSWQWTAPETKPDSSGTTEYQAKFIPDSAVKGNYTESVGRDCSVTFKNTVNYSCYVTYNTNQTYTRTYTGTWQPSESLEISLTEQPTSDSGNTLYLTSTTVKYRKLNGELVEKSASIDNDGMMGMSDGYSCVISSKTIGTDSVMYTFNSGYEPGTDIEITLNIRMASTLGYSMQSAAVSITSLLPEEDSKQEFEKQTDTSAETELAIQNPAEPVTEAVSGDSQTMPTEAETQTQPAAPETEIQVTEAVTETQTEPAASTEAQTNPPETEPETAAPEPQTAALEPQTAALESQTAEQETQVGAE